VNDLERRAHRHAALGDPTRLAIAEELLRSDRSPGELGDLLGLPSNLAAHHIAVLERAGIVRRGRSEGDRRRKYLQLDRAVAESLGLAAPAQAEPVLFVCTHNSARSQLAAAAWRRAVGAPAESAGTHPAPRVHPGALAAAKRAGLDLAGTLPRHIADVATTLAVVITVCDRAHEELEAPADWWHWSIPDPVGSTAPDAFDTALHDITRRIAALTPEGTDT